MAMREDKPIDVITEHINLEIVATSELRRISEMRRIKSGVAEERRKIPISVVEGRQIGRIDLSPKYVYWSA